VGIAVRYAAGVLPGADTITNNTFTQNVVYGFPAFHATEASELLGPFTPHENLDGPFVTLLRASEWSLNPITNSYFGRATGDKMLVDSLGNSNDTPNTFTVSGVRSGWTGNATFNPTGLFTDPANGDFSLTTAGTAAAFALLLADVPLTGADAGCGSAPYPIPVFPIARPAATRCPPTSNTYSRT